MTFPAPPLVTLLYYAVTVVAFGLIVLLYIRAGKLPVSEARQRKLLASLRNRQGVAIVVVLIMWIIAQMLLAEFAPVLPRLNP